MQLQLNKHRRAGAMRARRTTRLASTKLVHRNDLRRPLARATTHPAQITWLRHHHRERAGMRICRLRAWTAIKSGGRRRGTGERWARSNRSLWRKKWISYPRAEEGKKNAGRSFGEESAGSRRTRLSRPNGKQVFRSEKEDPRAVRLYKIAKRRNYFICPCRPYHNIIKSRLVTLRYARA